MRKGFLKNNQINVLLLFLMIIGATNISKAEYNEHNVLILHSYHQGLEWTDNISEGILEVFKDRTDVNLVFEYLDIKRNQKPDYYKELHNLYKNKSRTEHFDAIILSDNGAFEFMQQYGDKLYPNIPVLFCGINNLDTLILRNLPNYRGLGERADHCGTIKAIQYLFPERKNVLVVNDNTITGRAMMKEMEIAVKKFDNQLNFEFFSEFTIPTLREKIKTLDDSYSIYLLVINQDMNGKFISYRKGISEINEVSQVPIFGSWDFYENRGIIGGKIIRGKDQGLYIAQMALDIIDGKSPDSLKRFQFLESSYMFDYLEMGKYGIKNSDLPDYSTILNAPYNKAQIIKIGVTIIVTLFVILLILATRLRLKRKREAEMERIIKERTAELKKTNQKLSEIIIKKNKFFSILAHDLRNSVNVFLNGTMLLNDRQFSKNTEKTEKIKHRLQIAANQTYGIIEDLLYWGVNQFKKDKNIEITKIDIEALIESIVEKFIINENDITFKMNLEPDLSVCTDENICRFILRNIIQNSLKFTPHKGQIFISTAKSIHGVEIKIEDTGIGMERQIIESIFAKNPIQRQGLKGQTSTGIGLPTAIEYLEQIQGSLKIDSIPEVSSTFTITFTHCNNETNTAN